MPSPMSFFICAIANELTHSIPPQAPVFAGRPLNYHYGMDLAVAMFANATGLETPDLLLRFVPTLFLALSMLSVYCFASAWLESGYFGVLVVFFVFFGEDFSFIPGLLLGEKGDWSVRFFNVPSVLSLFYTNAMLTGSRAPLRRITLSSSLSQRTDGAMAFSFRSAFRRIGRDKALYCRAHHALPWNWGHPLLVAL